MYVCAHMCRCGRITQHGPQGTLFASFEKGRGAKVVTLELRASLPRSCVGYIQRPEGWLCAEEEAQPRAVGRGSFLKLSHAGLISRLRPEEEVKFNLKAVTSESTASWMMAGDTRGMEGGAERSACSSELLRTNAPHTNPPPPLTPTPAAPTC